MSGGSENCGRAGDQPGELRDRPGGGDRKPASSRARAADLTATVKARYAGSIGERVWGRLSSLDFINRGMLFAAILLLCFIPFVIIANALAGHSAATSLVRHFGLNQQAAADVSRVFASPSATSSAITASSFVFFILGGIAAATAIQDLYEGAFGIKPRGLKDMARRLMWLAALVGVSALAAWTGPWLHRNAGPVVLGLAGLVAFTAFWWFTMWLLLGGRMSWRDLFPSALATGACWLGMIGVFGLTMSGTITSDYNKYGSIGVIFALMSFLIAIGVVIILGAIVGVVWRERHALAR